jgi:hypothetical protein
VVDGPAGAVHGGEALSALTTDQVITLVEVLVILLGIAITWAIYYGSENAELPGESTIPEPMVKDDLVVDTRGRTLE